MLIEKKCEIHVSGGNTSVTSYFFSVYLHITNLLYNIQRGLQFFLFSTSDTEVLPWPSSKDWRSLSMNVLKRDIAAMKVPSRTLPYQKRVGIELKSQIHFKFCCFWKTFFLLVNLFRKAFSAAKNPNKTEVCTVALFFGCGPEGDMVWDHVV